MIAATLLAAQLSGAAPPPDSGAYASPALRRLVAEAAVLNATVPPRLLGYRATVESELSFGNQLGEREVTAGLEQVSSRISWRRDGEFSQHVVGHRSQVLGPSPSALGFVRSSWLAPSLYGNRLSLIFGIDTSARRRRAASAGQPPSVAVHPLASDRDSYYRFSGGDTTQTIVVQGRVVRVVRVRVEPRDGIPRGTYFRGDLDLDADRRQMVRLQGALVSVAMGPTGILNPARLLQLEGVAFIEFVNAEFDGEFWLPSYQRFDAQATAPTLTNTRAVFRVISRFHDLTPELAASLPPASDTLRPHPHLFTLASRDSIGRFAAWRADLGSLAAPVSATEFDSVAPGAWKPTGPPILRMESERTSDLFRYNRVEGAFTGVGLALRLRDAAPGTVIRATGGIGWHDREFRGRLSIERRREAWTMAALAGRVLNHTNDFSAPLDSGSTFSALFGADDFDYLERTVLGGRVSRRFNDDGWLLQAEAARVDDRALSRGVVTPPFSSDTFRLNRGIDPGRYLRSGITVRFHPRTSADFLAPGIGATLAYQRGDGELTWQRAELTLEGRVNRGQWSVAGRLDAGAASGTAPPQQLFEMGGPRSLPGYEYKEFAGNQAVLFRSMVSWRTDVLATPLRLTRSLWLPAPNPTLALSLVAGWAGATGNDARMAIRRLRSTTAKAAPQDDPPISSVTGDPRTSISAEVRLFGSSVGFGVTRPLDHSAPWRFQVRVGQPF